MKLIATLAASAIAITAMASAQAQELRFISNDTDCGAEYTLKSGMKAIVTINLETAIVGTGVFPIDNALVQANSGENVPLSFTFDDGSQAGPDSGWYAEGNGTNYLLGAWTNNDDGLDMLDMMGASKGMTVSYAGKTDSVVDGVWVSNGYNHMLNCMEQRSPLFQ